MREEDYILELERKIFSSLVRNSAVERLQVSHVRDLAREAAEVFIDEMKFYQWEAPKPNP